MNIGQLREIIKNLPDDIELSMMFFIVTDGWGSRSAWEGCLVDDITLNGGKLQFSGPGDEDEDE